MLGDDMGRLLDDAGAKARDTISCPRRDEVDGLKLSSDILERPLALMLV